MTVTPKQFYATHSKDQCAELAKRAGTSPANFQQIALGGSVGKKLAESLAAVSGGKMTELEILYPERYENEEKEQAA